MSPGIVTEVRKEPARGGIVRARPAMLLVCLAAILPGCARPPAERASPPWNLLLLTLDTTRADRLGCYGHGRALTGTLDRLAGEGILFENAVSACPITLPAHASVLTGLYPTRHGVRGNAAYRLPQERTTLAEILAGAGYATAAVTGAFVLDRRYGLDQGFDRYDDEGMARRSDVSDPERAAPEVTEAALRGLATLPPGRPFFLWVHYYDPHAPLRPPRDLAARFPPDAGGLYDAEIAAMDRAIGRLLAGMKASGRLEHTLTVVVGDHGEGFAGPHDEESHGFYLYQDTLHVPLILHAPGLVGGKGRRVAAVVRQVDLAPTILDLLRIPPPAPWETDGTSFAGVVAGGGEGGGEAPAVDSYSETLGPWDEYGWSPLFEIRRGSWTFIEAPTPELYDLDADREQAKNVAGEHPQLVAELRGVLARILAASTPRDETFSPGLVRSRADVERLRALGYVVPGGGEIPPPEVRRTLKDPKEWLALHGEISRARTLHQEGRTPEAVRLVRSVLERDPGNYHARSELARFLLGDGRLEEAIRELRELPRLRPWSPDGHFRLGEALRRRAAELAAAGRKDEARKAREEAIRAFEQGARLEHIDVGHLINLGVLYLETGRNAEAEGVLRRSLGMDPRPYEIYTNLGLALLREGRAKEAERVLEGALATFGSDRGKGRALRLQLLDVYNRTLNAAGARESLEWLLANFPADPNAALYRRTLGRLPPREGRQQ